MMQQNDFVFMQKENQRQREKQINKYWKSARSNFFTHQIKQKLSDAKIQGKQQALIIDLFAKVKHKYQQRKYMNQLGINLNDLGHLAIHREIIQFLVQSFQSIQKQYYKQLRQPQVIKQIIKQKITNLRVIYIQYKTQARKNNDGQVCLYSISAFELFKVIQINKQLNQVTIKGVFVQQFHKFMNLLYCLMNQKPVEQQPKHDIGWMTNFSPSKSLKLSINARMNFDLSDENDSVAKINILLFFKSLFYQISGIHFYILLGKWNQINQWAQIYQNLLQFIKEFKKIKISIQGFLIQHFLPGSCIRAVLFGALASLTEISQLSFLMMILRLQDKINDFLGIQQTSEAIFKNNTITHLKIDFGDYFPPFYKITTLQSIQITVFSTHSRKLNDSMTKMTQANPSLRSIKCFGMQSQWIIDEALFNRLENLILINCKNTILDILSQSPSNIKKLIIQSINIGRTNLLTAFRKLVSLNYLQLSGIDFGCKALEAIPSNNLCQLHIRKNNIITDQDFELIDAKWPQLTAITICACRNITKNVWSICEFKGLMQVVVGKEALGEKDINVRQLKHKGIKVNYN